MATEEQESTLADIEAEEQAEAGLPSWGADDADTDIDVVVEGEGDGEVEPVVEPPAGETPEPAIAAVVAPEPEEPVVPGEPAVTDADLEETDKAYPEPIKKRIKREIRIRKRVEAEFEQVRGAAIQAVQYAQSKETELTVAQDTINSLRKQHAEVLDVAFDKDIALKKISLKAAREEGKYDDEMRIQSELNTLQFQQNQIRDVKRTLDQAPVPAAKPAAQAATQPAPAREPPEPLAVAWVTNNNTWFSNPKFAGHKQFVLGVDTQLVKEGYNKKSKAYYEELDRRIDEAFPTLRKAAPKTEGGGPPVAPVTGGGGKPLAKNMVRLTRVDLANMRRFGLDPANKTHLRQYALEKRSPE